MASDESNTWSSHDEGVHVSLTTEPLNIMTVVNDVRSPKAGATVLFAGRQQPFCLLTRTSLTIFLQAQPATISRETRSRSFNIRLTSLEL